MIKIKFNRDIYLDTSDMCKWCEANVGKFKVAWYWEWPKDSSLADTIVFKEESDAVVFRLKFKV